jgi:hypothetical protein
MLQNSNEWQKQEHKLTEEETGSVFVLIDRILAHTYSLFNLTQIALFCILMPDSLKFGEYLILRIMLMLILKLALSFSYIYRFKFIRFILISLNFLRLQFA